jgi:hypothetical protein
MAMSFMALGTEFTGQRHAARQEAADPDAAAARR